VVRDSRRIAIDQGHSAAGFVGRKSRAAHALRRVLIQAFATNSELVKHSRTISLIDRFDMMLWSFKDATRSCGSLNCAGTCGPVNSSLLDRLDFRDRLLLLFAGCSSCSRSVDAGDGPAGIGLGVSSGGTGVELREP
jgi:hypothetical protein